VHLTDLGSTVAPDNVRQAPYSNVPQVTPLPSPSSHFLANSVCSLSIPTPATSSHSTLSPLLRMVAVASSHPHGKSTTSSPRSTQHTSRRLARRTGPSIGNRHSFHPINPTNTLQLRSYPCLLLQTAHAPLTHVESVRPCAPQLLATPSDWFSCFPSHSRNPILDNRAIRRAGYGPLHSSSAQYFHPTVCW